MTKLFKVITVGVLSSVNLFSQTDTAVIITDTIPKETISVQTVVDTPIVTREENELSLWRSGKTKYAPKPKHVWEVGVHSGIFLIDGDVDQKHLVPGIGYGLHVRRAIHYVFSIRVDGFYGITYGCDPQPSSSGLSPEQFYKEPSGNLRAVFDGYGPNNEWFANYKTTLYSLSVQGILNIGNILFHKPSNKWNWYLVIGLSGYSHTTMLNLRDANNNVYNNLISQTNYNNLNFNTRKGRQEIKKNLDDIYDNTYETESYVRKGVFRFNDETNVHLAFIGGVGIARKINRRFNIALEHQLIASDNDYLDGIHWRTDVDQTNNDDIGHYTHLRLGINLGNLKKKTEPLYWLNPLDAIFSDIAELKQRPKFDTKDTDQDGVIDMLDQEVETAPGAPVDTRGIALDSDTDGIPDYKDEEPFSQPGYQVNEKGIAQIPVKPQITEDDVKRIIDQKAALGGYGPDSNNNNRNNSELLDWFLPMIHFNLDEYCIKTQYYAQLHHVATVMQSHPNLKVTAIGHTDLRANNAYNNVLSYNRAKSAIDYLVSKYNIPRERFILMYGGEDNPLGPTNNNHFINRRVEFRVSQKDDVEMARPAGPEAGECHKKRIRKSGNVKTDDGTEKDKKVGY
ncbi:MAG: OmpA family protein [Saprospiraceae bacterium]